MKCKHLLFITVFVFFSFVLAGAQTRRIEAKKKTQEEDSPAMTNPEVVFNIGHSSMVTSVCYSSDGKYLASASLDDTIKLWEVETGRLLRTLAGHTNDVCSVCYSPDGKYLASGSDDYTIKLWEVKTGECVQTLIGHTENVTSVCYSPDGKYLASGSNDNTIKLWEVKTGECVQTLIGHTSTLTSVCYSPDGQYIASGSYDSTIKLWEVKTGECIKTFDCIYEMTYVCYSPDGKYLATVNSNRIYVYEIKTGKQRKISADGCYNMRSLCYSPDGKYLASGADDSTIKLWDLKTGECIKTFGYTTYTYHVCYSPDGKHLASASYLSCKLWEVKTGECIELFGGRTACAVSLSYSPNGKYVVSTDEFDKIKLWDAKTGERIKTLSGHTHHVTLVCCSPDGKYVASGSYDKTIKIWDVETGKCIKTLDGHTGIVNSLCYSPDGRYLASATYDLTIYPNYIIKLWDVETGECIKTLTGHTETVEYVCYSPDGRYLASSSKDKTIKLWEVATGDCIRTLIGHTSSVRSVCYSPDGKYLASGSVDKTIKLWEVAMGECIKTLSGHTESVESVCYSPDGKYLLAMHSWDNIITLWEVKTGECIKTLSGNKALWYSVSYIPDCKYLTSDSDDSTIKLWDAKTGKCIKTFSGNTGCVNVICYSPDGKYLATASDDNAITFWNVSTGEPLASTFNFTFEIWNTSTGEPLAKDGEWLTYTPEGFFAGSEWASKNLVHIVDGMKTVGIDQMFDSLYRPDLVASKLRGEDISIHAQRVDIASLVRTGSAPITTFLSLDEKITNRDVTIEFAIENTGGGIGEVNLLLNGKNIRLAEKVASKSGETVHFSHTITLQNGENILELYAKNGAGKVESLRARKTLNWHGNTKKPNLYLLTAAINQYRDRQLQLKYAVPDAQIITQGFLQQKKSLYQNIFNYNLFDGDVTKDGLKASFEKLASQVQADDVFVFYIAGHGVTYDEDGDYYYLPSDFRYTSSESIAKNGISKNDLTRCLSLIKAGKTLVLMDTCNSGSFLSANSRGMSEKTAIDRLTRSTGHATIVASSDSQSAMEGYEGHGIFTYILVEGLSGKADADGDGFITLQELSSYVEEEVPRRSFDKWGYEQTPMRDLRKQDFPVYATPSH